MTLVAFTRSFPRVSCTARTAGALPVHWLQRFARLLPVGKRETGRAARMLAAAPCASSVSGCPMGCLAARR